jgi:hypothetical protein
VFGRAPSSVTAYLSLARASHGDSGRGSFRPGVLVELLLWGGRSAVSAVRSEEIFMTDFSALDAAGQRRSPGTLLGYHVGRPPRSKGMRYPADAAPRSTPSSRSCATPSMTVTAGVCER